MNDDLLIEDDGSHELTLDVLDTRGTALHCATALVCTWLSMHPEVDKEDATEVGEHVLGLAEHFQRWLERDDGSS